MRGPQAGLAGGLLRSVQPECRIGNPKFAPHLTPYRVSAAGCLARRIVLRAMRSTSAALGLSACGSTTGRPDTSAGRRFGQLERADRARQTHLSPIGQGCDRLLRRPESWLGVVSNGATGEIKELAESRPLRHPSCPREPQLKHR